MIIAKDMSPRIKEITVTRYQTTDGKVWEGVFDANEHQKAIDKATKHKFVLLAARSAVQLYPTMTLNNIKQAGNKVLRLVDNHKTSIKALIDEGYFKD